MAFYLNCTAHTLDVVTYNLHDLNQGRPQLNHLCDNLLPYLIFIQEHWQSPANLNNVIKFSKNYCAYGISAMHEAVSKGILIGRAFGGTCILVKNEHDLHTNQLLCTNRSFEKIGFINVYLPCSIALHLLLKLLLLKKC